jgi:uncharacterized membrane protein YcaP (DUF421 family)
MESQQPIKVFDWRRVFLEYETPIEFFSEIALRTAIMFVVTIILLKMLNKRGIKQLSVFELAILIGLGSATGDPMFYHNIPILHGLLVIVVVIILYKLFTFVGTKSKRLQIFLEGKAKCLIEDGKIVHDEYKRINLPLDKFFGELRQESVDHLGQLRKVYIETSGELSIYFFEDDQVKPGLPIYPDMLHSPLTRIENEGAFACIFCGNIQELLPADEVKCKVCASNNWLPPSSVKRVT